MSVILGSGEFRYRIVEDWAKLPDGWEFMDQAPLDPLARTAEFRNEYWDDPMDTPYRVTFDWESGSGKETAVWRGTIRRNPVDQPLVSLAVPVVVLV